MQPVDELVGADPYHLSLADLDFRDALHARAQALGRARQRRFDAKVAAPVAGRRNGRETGHRERVLLARNRGEEQAALLAGLDVRDVALVDFKHNAIGAERRNLEQHLASLDGAAERLVEVSADDDAVEWSGNPGAAELLG